MKETLEALNRMQADRVIEKYAIGGAVGATFYLEPSATIDLDIFVMLPESGGLLLSLSPIYEYLDAHGWKAREEYVDIAGWPVQFLPPANDLEREALSCAGEADVDGVKTWVLSAEHLIAIALKTGRAKDHNRILQFISEKAFDPKKLDNVLAKHELAGSWKKFIKRFAGE